ncbi:MAG: PKD domain-containing protein [Candidatus Pacebacteria bacterium]|nr:PKD domain-containing protein [Candidatus Paceibacterota bacterium]
MKIIRNLFILTAVVFAVFYFSSLSVDAAQNPNFPAPTQCNGASWDIGAPEGVTCSSSVSTLGALEQDYKATLIFGSPSRLKPDLNSLNQFCKQYTQDANSYAFLASVHNYCTGYDQNLSWWDGSSWITIPAAAGTLNVQNVRCATNCGMGCVLRSSKQCFGNNVYWYDSCGNRGELYQACSSNQVCQNGQCVNTVCSSNSDCGTNGYVGNTFCQSGNVYQDYKTYTCLNPGTSSSSCTSSTEAKLKQVCSGGQTCQNGYCVQTQELSVETNQATNISSNQATLNGNLLNLGGMDSANVWFEWGQTSSYGRETSHYSKYNTGSFSAAVYDLSPNTLYHFRAVAENSRGVSYGADRTFYSSGSGQSSPTAYAGPDRDVYEGQSVYLNGSGSDPEGGSLYYYWTCTGGNLSNANNPQPLYTASYVSSTTTYTCTLRVTDNTGLTGYDDVRIRVLDKDHDGSICPISNSTCYYPDSHIYLGQTINSCLNDYSNKYYKVTGISSDEIKITLNWSGYGCNLNYLRIYDSNCSQIYSDTSNNWTKTWQGKPYSDIVIGLEGRTSNNNCSFSLTAERVSSGGMLERFSVEKYVKNLTKGDSGFYNTINADPNDLLVFEIRVRSNIGSLTRDLIVKDTLPSNLIYKGNLKINNVSVSGDARGGINTGDLSPNQIKTISFEAQVASVENFTYGTTTLINTALAYSSDYSDTNTAKVLVTRKAIGGATTIITGITDNILFDSLIIPLIFALIAVWLFKSKIVSFEQWLDLKKEKYQNYRSNKILEKKIGQIKGKELFTR